MPVSVVGGVQARLFLTDQGNRYHTSLYCSGLKRTVYTVTVSTGRRERAMQEMLRYGLMALFFRILYRQDMRTGRISFYCNIGIWYGWNRHKSAGKMSACHSALQYASRVLVFCCLAGCRENRLDMGMDWSWVVAGLFLKGEGAVSLFSDRTVLCAVGGIILYITGKVNRKSALPFLPFLLAYLGVHIVFVCRL